MKIFFKSLLSHLTGVSTPLLGLSWTPPTDERKIAEEVVTFLEGRRVLLHSMYHPQVFRTNATFPMYSLRSIMEIRAYLTKTMTKLPRKSALFGLLRDMRNTCQDCAPALEQSANEPRSNWDVKSICEALAYFKSRMAWLIASLSIRYQIDVAEELVPFEISNDSTVKRTGGKKGKAIRRRREGKNRVR